MPTKLHSQLSGADLHPNKVDGTTGTGLTAASETFDDARWVKGQTATNAATTSTVTNTTTETAFSQIYTFALNTLTVGKTIRLIARGIYSTAASPGTLGLRVKFGTTTLGYTLGITPTANLTNKGWQIDPGLPVLTTGVSGTVEAQGFALYAFSNSNANIIDMGNTAAITVDTTAS